MHKQPSKPNSRREEKLDELETGPRAELASVADLIEHYALGTIHAIRDLGGAYNLNALLNTESGAYVLRIHRPWVTMPRLGFEHHVRRLLAGAGFPVALPVPTITGADILVHQQRLIELEPFIFFDTPARRWEHFPALFTLLGDLHTFLEQELPPESIVPPMVSNYATPVQLIEQVEQTLALINDSQYNYKMVEVQQAREICQVVLQMLAQQLPWWYAEGQYLPHRLTHGDYGMDNVLFHEGRIVALLDFDFLAVRERIFDLAYAIYWIYWGLEDVRYPELAPWQRVRTLLAAYNQTSAQPLLAEEIQALALELIRIPLYWIAEAGFLPDPVQAVLEQKDAVAYALRLFQQRDALTKAFTLS
ncbi:hypothetical protein KDA_14550 [Dictyobacter alpinus]|uniref:Aminoglycoside phosphotransferase domain-containing protein n=1 Tax=Dictyobacter alpinus TaxID=2014873 RepID=A0A402B3P6_9CHLR|nr:phosphotransferase [Dictyobacter alpinus]GCE25971.1 hypothetical protein KDA_14550 [Dictyobacter alpinus]